MADLTITVTRDHEMFGKIFEGGFATGLTHNMVALAVKESQNTQDVEALYESLYINGKGYDAITKVESLTELPENKSLKITYKRNPMKDRVPCEVVYIGDYLIDIYMATHPIDGLRRVKTLKYQNDTGYLVIFYHDCLITNVHNVEKHGVFTHSVKRIDRNNGKNP